MSAENESGVRYSFLLIRPFAVFLEPDSANELISSLSLFALFPVFPVP